jgi:hypothetical protein
MYGGAGFSDGVFLALSIATGAHPKLISARPGHSSITITLDRDGHLFPSVEEALADALDAAFTRQCATPPSPPVEPRAIGSSDLPARPSLSKG